MTEKAKRVVRGYMALNNAERDDFLRSVLDEMNESVRRYNDALNKGLIKEAAEKLHEMNFGPLPTGCPCCGR